MSGIDRLRALAGAWDEWGLGGTLAEIADEIERELVRHDEPDSTDKGTRLLYVTDEDRETLEWVRKYGGIGCVQTMAAKLGDTLNWIRERVGIGEDEVVDYDELLDALDRRLMPEGIEWPRYKSGELVQIGDDVIGRCGDDPIKVRSVEFRDGDIYLREGFKTDRVVIVYPGERVKRPVLAADGEPLEQGQTVWHVTTGHEYIVMNCTNGGAHLSRDGRPAGYCRAEYLTHQRPVLDADGVPINVGDTVYEVGENYPPFVVGRLPEPGAYRSVRVVYPSGAFTFLDPERLTHTKPEPTDNLERIADEIDRLREDVALHLGDYLYDSDGNDSIQFSMELVAKRCRALAERERGE